MEEPKQRDKSKSKRKSALRAIDKQSASVASTTADHDNDEDDDDELRRRETRAIRRAKRHEKEMAALGLDINGEPLDNYSLQQYPVREYKLSIRGFQGHIALNPVVNLIGLVCLWSVVAWTAADPKGSTEQLTAWSDGIILKLSWLLQLSSALSLFVVVIILYKYGHVHLGRPDEKPEFSFLTALAMMLASATGPTLLIFGVSEPLSRARTNTYGLPSYHSQDELDMFAVNMTLFRWGMMTWTHLALVGVGLSLASHRFGLPLTFRSSFYPLFGAYTWGWIGDAIDGIALVATVVGACITMGFASWQLVSCFVYLGWMGDSIEEIGMMLVLTIWIITILSTASVISGLRGGVRFVSRVAFGLSVLLLLLVSIFDDTAYLLNLQVQAFGFHFQINTFQMNFWTDTFDQLRPGSGRAVDSDEIEESWYRKHSALVYAAIAMSSVLGMLAAHVSRGRKLWELVMLTLVLPILYTLVWFCSWGGIGLRQDRQAMELEQLGSVYFNNSAHFLTDGSQYCYDVPQHDVVVGNATIFTNYLLGVTPVCQYDSANHRTLVLRVLSSFRFEKTFGRDGVGPFLVMLFALTVALNLIASSDSGSLMVDGLASNARMNYHWLRRLFWAGTVGILTTALIALGGVHFRESIEALIVVCTAPLLFVTCGLVHPTLALCRAANDPAHLEETEYRIPDQPEFEVPLYGGIFNVVEYVASMGKVNPVRVQLGMRPVTTFQVVESVKGFVVPFVSLNQVLNATYPDNHKTNAMLVAVHTVLYLAWFGTFVASRSHPGLNAFMWAFLAACGGILCLVRSSFRTRHNLRSNIIADVLGSLFLWPQVLTQMRVQCVSASTASSIPKEADDDDKPSKDGHCTAQGKTKSRHGRNSGRSQTIGKEDEDEYA